MRYGSNAGNNNYIVTLIKGVGISYIVTLAFVLILAIVMTYTSLSEGIIPLLNSIIMILSIAFGAIYMSLKVSSRGWINGGILGVVYMLITILISTALGSIIFDIYLIMKVLIALVTGSVGGMIGVNLK